MATVLVIGSGAREHAICRQFLLSPQVSNVYCAPGNIGMQSDEITCVAIDELNFVALINFAQVNKIDLTFVGPELPLQQGIVDAFKQAKLTIFGPAKRAAALEGSKKFAKKIMEQAGVPTATYKSFKTEKSALTALKTATFPIVIKANGLAAGKGVVVASDLKEANMAVHQMLGSHQFNTQEIIIEEFLQGQEFSLMAFVSGRQIVPMPLSQDHKAAFDGDQGPNTGGMGAYSPVPQIATTQANQMQAQILQPVVDVMADNGYPFTGILYAGLMMTKDGVKVIEFNVRLGDPETSVVLPQLKSDFYQLVMDLLQHHKSHVEWQTNTSFIGVVVAAEGYPVKTGHGDKLTTFESLPANITCDFAGVSSNEHELVSHGGRILCLVTHAKSLVTAQTKLYQWLDQQQLTGLRYRHDIGMKARQ